MNERIKKITNSKIFLVGIIILFMILIAATGTYAWLTWSSGENNTNLTMTIGNLADVFFTSGNDITTGLTPVFNYTDGESTTFSVKTKTSDGSSYNIKLNITSIDSELTNDESVKYVLVKDGELVANESLKDIASGSSISIYNTSFEIGTTSYVFYLYIDGNMENNSNMIGKTISGNLTIELVEESINLIDHITSLYTSYSNKVIATNNSIDYYYADIYDKDTNEETNGGLMNDRLGGIEELSSGTGNIRYYGANPNNYIYFNCDKYPNTNCELWRIIGVFKNIELADGTTQDLVKIVRDQPIGNLAWDQDKNSDSSLTTYKAYWNDSSLNALLNGTYYNRGTTDSVIYYSGASGDISTTLEMNKIGIKNNTTKMIENVKWIFFGKSTNSVYSDQVYNAERITGEANSLGENLSNFGTSKIALMYPSDYGYATDFNDCTGTLGNYNTSGCFDNDWIYQADTKQWLLISIYSGVSAGKRAWYISDTGLAYSDYGDGATSTTNSYVYLNNAVRPTMYLSSNVSINTAEGTRSNPYRIIE